MDRVARLTAESVARELEPLLLPWRRDDAPGIAVGVMRAGEVLFSACHGLAELAHGVALDDRSVIRIASQSKQFTVLLLLLLAADGKLSLDDDVHRYVPGLPEYGYHITLRHLASNTSGLRDILESMILAGVPILAPSSRGFARDLVAAQRTLNFPPGEDLLYSNTNFLLLSEIIEGVAGQSYDAVLRERITSKLGMSDTGLMVRDDEIRPRLAGHYRKGADGRWLKSAWGIAIGGEGGLVSSLRDMLLWKANMRAPVVGTPAMFAAMKAPGAMINGVASPYGMGLGRVAYRGHAISNHGGWIAGARSESVRFEDLDLDIVVLSNTDEIAPFILARQMADALLGVRATLLSAGQAGRLCAASGTYRQIDGDELFRIAVQNGQPLLVSSMGTAGLIDAGAGRVMPHVSLPPFTMAIGDDGTIETERFGRPRRFRPLPARADAARLDAEGRYAGFGLTAELQRGATGMTMVVTSAFGRWRAALEPCAADLLLVRAEAPDIHDAWRVAPWALPWLYTLRIEPDRIVLNSDRSRGIVLERVRG